MEKTVVQQLIDKFTFIKENKCKSVQELIFFDGVLAIIQSGKYLELEQRQIEDTYASAVSMVYEDCKISSIDESEIKKEAKKYYKQTFNICNKYDKQIAHKESIYCLECLYERKMLGY